MFTFTSCFLIWYGKKELMFFLASNLYTWRWWWWYWWWCWCCLDIVTTTSKYHSEAQWLDFPRYVIKCITVWGVIYLRIFFSPRYSHAINPPYYYSLFTKENILISQIMMEDMRVSLSGIFLKKIFGKNILLRSLLTRRCHSMSQGCVAGCCSFSRVRVLAHCRAPSIPVLICFYFLSVFSLRVK